MNYPAPLLIAIRIAGQNLVGHRRKSIIVGTVLAAEALVVVLGLSLMQSVDAAMERNVTSSFVGDFQLLSSSAGEETDLFGGADGTFDTGYILDFPSIRAKLAEVPNVKHLVPMGWGTVAVRVGNPLDRVLQELRDATRREDRDRQSVLAASVREQISRLDAAADLGPGCTADCERPRPALAEYLSDEFWNRFRVEPLAGLERLENEVAPRAGEMREYWLRYVGTDLSVFPKAFERFELTAGAMIPPGETGILLNEQVHDWFKDDFAGALETLFNDVVRDRKPMSDKTFGYRVEELVSLRRGLMGRLDLKHAEELRARLAEAFPAVQGGLNELLSAFLQLTMENLAARYELFNQTLAPAIGIHSVNVGDTIVLEGLTEEGYPRAAKCRVYGTFRLKGLEGFEQANLFSIIDLSTFRLLHGDSGPEARAEVLALQREVNPTAVSRDQVEATLFVDPSALETHANRAGEPGAKAAIGAAKKEPELGSAPQNLKSADDDVVGTVAVVLRDARQVDVTRAELAAVIHRDGFDLRVVDWRQAAGLLAQYLSLVRVQLYVGLLIIFLVVLFVVNTAVVLAVLDRTAEFGTLRAMGAQRMFIRLIVLLESGLLGLVSAGVGIGAGMLLLLPAANTGIPAFDSYVVRFLFGGDRLYPSIQLSQVIVSLVATVGVAIVASLYPVRMAVRVSPVTAMSQRGDS